MRVAVLDVGSNTVTAARRRASARRGPARSARSARTSRSATRSTPRPTPTEKLDGRRRSSVPRRLRARSSGPEVDALDVIVTAPDDRAENADELVGALAVATGPPCASSPAGRRGSARLRGRCRFARSLPRDVAVCDRGRRFDGARRRDSDRGPTGGSARRTCGAVRLTRRFLRDDPPGGKVAMAAAA